MFKKRNIIILSLLIALLFMSVGYCLLATDFEITGTTEIVGNWNIAITDVKVINESPDIKAEFDFTDTSLNFKTLLNKPGDSVTYQVTLENRGTIAADLSQVLFKEGDEGSSAIKYETKNFDPLLEAGEKSTFLITTTYDEKVTEVPLNKIKNLAGTIEYVQN